MEGVAHAQNVVTGTRLKFGQVDLVRIASSGSVPKENIIAKGYDTDNIVCRKLVEHVWEFQLIKGCSGLCIVEDLIFLQEFLISAQCNHQFEAMGCAYDDESILGGSEVTGHYEMGFGSGKAKQEGRMVEEIKVG